MLAIINSIFNILIGLLLSIVALCLIAPRLDTGRPIRVLSTGFRHWQRRYRARIWPRIGVGLLLIAGGVLIRGAGPLLGLAEATGRELKDTLMTAGMLIILISIIIDGRPIKPPEGDESKRRADQR
jgi:hypothetical protein